MAFEKLAILGAGAVGSVIGAYLTRAGRDITLIDTWPAHVEQMRRAGLKVTAQEGEFTVKVKALHLADVCSLHEQFDVVFLSVKSYDSVWAAQFILPYLNPAGILVSAQNGINEDCLAPLVGYTRTIGCVITGGVALYEAGHVTRTSPFASCSYALGELNGMITPRLEALAKVLTPAGAAHPTANLWGIRWGKLIANCMGNAIAGISGLNDAEMRAYPEIFPITVKIAGEALTVAETLGVQAEPVGGVPAQVYREAARGVGLEELRAKWMEAGRFLGTGRPSLLQDVMKGRRTEVDNLNGYVVRQGKAAGVPTPMNAAIVEATQRVETGALTQDPANLKLLTPYL